MTDKERECRFCGKTFSPVTNAQKFCTKLCRERFWRKKQPAPVHRYKGECAWCGAEFTTNIASKKTCTQKCNWQLQNSRRKTTKSELRVCNVCGEEFRPMQKRGVGRTYCSANCRNKASYRRRKTYQHQKSWEWRKKKKWGGNWWAALSRDGFTCQLCSNKIFPSQWNRKTRLVVHHKDGTGEEKVKNHNISNLMTLCSYCHRLFHGTISVVVVDGAYKIKGKIFDVLGLESLPVHRNGDINNLVGS